MMYPKYSNPEIAPSESFIRGQYSYLKTMFGERNGEYRTLRRIFDGKFASKQEADARTGAILSDRISMIYNIANATVRRYMDSMSAPPRLESVPEGFELEDIERADKRTKFLEYVYQCNGMNIKLMQAAYYQSLLDKAIFNVRPAPHLKHKIRIELCVPDFYFPITRGDDWQHPVAVIYGFRQFKKQSLQFPNPMEFTGTEEFTDVIEYWDANWFIRLEDGVSMVIPHNLGLIPFFESHNLPIPHRFRGQGDVDQAVGLNEYLNTLMSAMGDMISYAAAPIAVVRGTKVGGTNLPFEPRAVWELERDAQVGFLQWTGAPPSVEAQILRTIQAIEDTTGVSSPAFGREIPSGTSGNAVRSLLAGFNTRLGTKQQMLGDCLTSMNECILLMAEKMFPNEPFRIVGENVAPGKSLGKKKMYEVRPSEFQGWYRNRVVFSPLDPSSTYFQEMDKFAKGIQSRYSTMKALGVQNVWDELERIRMERLDEAEHQNNLGLASKGEFARPQSQEEMDAQLQPLLDSIAKARGVSGANPRGLEQKQAEKKGFDAALKPTGATGELAPPASSILSPTGPSAQAEQKLDLNTVLAKLRKSPTLNNLAGAAHIAGDLVKNGQADNGMILLTNPADEFAIKQALGSDAQRFSFSRLQPNMQMPENSVPLGSQKKNQVAVSKIKSYLNVVVTQVEKTNNAYVYQIGLLDDKGGIVQIGKTNPQRRTTAEQGEIIRISIEGLSKRGDQGVTKWGLISPTPTTSNTVPASPSKLADLDRIFNQGVKSE